jgi:hypothetical protein
MRGCKCVALCIMKTFDSSLSNEAAWFRLPYPEKIVVLFSIRKYVCIVSKCVLIFQGGEYFSI